MIAQHALFSGYNREGSLGGTMLVETQDMARLTLSSLKHNYSLLSAYRVTA